ncbi:MAG: bifunctional UDP-N-acetylmuramoyl-tripeptide:D-alanyl-D-alanine ligase/alanine racemase [Ginsengibacter sp.]
MIEKIDYTLTEIAEIVNGTLLRQTTEPSLKYLLLDSRKLTLPEHTIFFALHADNFNNKILVIDLYKKGVTNFLIDEEICFEEQPSANFITVKNTLKALQALASHHRKQFGNLPGGHELPVVGVTGSNGKTIVKEWLNQLLENDFNIVRSPKSYNSQIGVPLSVLQINLTHTLAVFEAGISKKGEMEILENIIKPTIGIFTNIGSAHDEGFENAEEKIYEKLKLFTNVSVLIFCSDNGKVSSAINNFIKTENRELQVELFSWSKNSAAPLRIIKVEKGPDHSTITAIFRQREIRITIPFTDDASIENAITCWCVLLQMNIADKIIAERMSHLFPIEMRLELKEGINNCAIINDSYSADINSLSIALDFLAQQQQHPKHTVILSDVLQSGKLNKELYGEIASVLQQKKIHRLIAIGPKIFQQHEQFSFLKETNFYKSVKAFKNDFSALRFGNETILIKGARIFKFEQINKLLEKKIHQTILSINLNAIADNLKEYRRLLRPTTKIMAMVKAFSYGSGTFEVASLIQFHKVDYLGVAYADEGVELRKAGIALPIMVMNPDENTFDALVDYDLEPEIFSFAMLESFEKYLLSSAINYFPMHIKLDTGMHRLGFENGDIDSLAKRLHASKRFKVQSVFSHLVASEDADEDGFTLHQANVFLQGCQVFQRILGYNFIRHLTNTSGISRHPELQLDMVRLGVGLYGIDNNTDMQSKLKNVSTLTTTVAQIKKIKAGETVGYSRKAKVNIDSTIATVRIGYADGYPRNLSNGKGKMLLHNTFVPVIGNVCMDMTMLDITGITNVNEGDEVIVFGERLPLQYLAKWSNTIPYEIMTGISQRVKRIYFQE